MSRDLAAAVPSGNLAATMTLFSSIKTVTGTRVEVAWPVWLDGLCAPPPVVAEKKRGPGWSPALFAGDQRGNATVLAVSALVLDVDDGGSIDDALSAFAGYEGLLHTSYSHGATEDTTGRPCAPRVCFRVILPRARPVSAPEHGRLWAWAAEQALRHGVRLDPAPKAPGQLWFLPAVRPGAEGLYHATRLRGPVLDPAQVLAPPLAVPAPAPTHAPRPNPTLSGRRPARPGGARTPTQRGLGALGSRLC
jgi:hypothetical protein